MSSTDASIVLFDMYETTYGLFNHVGISKTRPLASVAMHESEDNTTTSALYEAIDRYHDAGIKDIFGLSLTEYLDLPSDICIKLAETSSNEANKKSAALGVIEKNFNRDLSR